MANYSENIKKAYEIRNGITKFMREVIEEFRTEKMKISSNRNLSYEGKQEETKKLQAKYEEGFLFAMKKKEDEINALLDRAKDDAEKVLTAVLPPVSETQQKLFNAELKKVEGRVMFALGTNQAMQAVESLMQAANEPLLAQQAQESFLKASNQVLGLAANNEKASIKQRLGAMYSQLEARSEVEGAKQTREALQTINAMKGAGYATGYVQEALKEISMNAYEYVNTPKTYFDKQAQA